MSKNKILILSVDPLINTGYGQISRRLIKVFKELDYDISFVSYYGAKFKHNYEGIDILPSFDGKYGSQACIAEVKINRPDYLLVTFDLFAIDQSFFKQIKEMGTKVISLLMIDASPYQSPNILPLSEVNYPITVTEVANKELPTDYQKITNYIPLGLDENYYMMDKRFARISFNKFIGADILNDESKLVSVVSANVGDSMGRKNFYGIIRGWQQYLEISNCKNKYLYLHTDVRGIQMGGIDIKKIMLTLKYTPEQASTIIFPSQIEYLNNEITTEELNVIYNSSDVYWNPAHGEGFGMPIVEAIAAGCSPLVTNFGAMRELINKTQINIDKHLMYGEPLYVGHSSIRCLVSPTEAAQKLQYLIENPVSIEHRALASQKAIGEYGHNRQVKLWSEFFNKIKED